MKKQMPLNTYAAAAVRAQIAAKQKAGAAKLASIAKPQTTKPVPTIGTASTPTTKLRTSTRAGDKLKARLTTIKSAGNYGDDIQKSGVLVGIH